MAGRRQVSPERARKAASVALLMDQTLHSLSAAQVRQLEEIRDRPLGAEQPRQADGHGERVSPPEEPGEPVRRPPSAAP